MGIKDSEDLLGKTVCEVLLVYQESLVSKAYQECLEILDHLGGKVIQGLLVQMVKMDLMAKLEILVPLETEENLEKMEVPEFKDCLAIQDLKEILDLLGYQDTKDHLESKEIPEYQVQKVKGVTEGQLDRKEILENQVHQDQKGHQERLEIQVLQENRDLLVNLENEDQGVQLANLEVQGLKVYLEWKEDLDQWVHLDHLVPLVTQ